MIPKLGLGTTEISFSSQGVNRFANIMQTVVRNGPRVPSGIGAWSNISRNNQHRWLDCRGALHNDRTVISHTFRLSLHLSGIGWLATTSYSTFQDSR